MSKINIPFGTTMIGSMPRSKELLALKEKSKNNATYHEAYLEKQYQETKDVIHLQEHVGIDVIVSGELDRDNYMSYIAEHVDGIKLMTMEELLALTSNNEQFNASLEAMDAADNSMNSPVCVDKIATDAEFIIKELATLQQISDKSFKATIPSPYLLTRTMFQKGVSSDAYENRKALGKDITKLLKNEIARVAALGASIIQLDEPILSEVVFQKSKGDTSFY